MEGARGDLALDLAPALHVHKIANVLDKLPKSVQPAAKAALREIWTAPDRATATTAIETFAEKYAAKYARR